LSFTEFYKDGEAKFGFTVEYNESGPHYRLIIDVCHWVAIK